LKNVTFNLAIWFIAVLMSSCSEEPVKKPDPVVTDSSFYFGADLSFVNQILDHQGVYKVSGTVRNPYVIFSEGGTKLVRLRLWHNPVWTKDVYGANGTQLYNDIADVEKAMASAKSNGMEVLLDFHYSDTWADPAKQFVPKAWKDVTDINVLRDSVFNYTFKTLSRLKAKGLLPELVQIGNETNCGMLFSEGAAGFPSCNVCDGKWTNMGAVLNAGIKAVRDINLSATKKTRVLLHVADPKNVEWWFDNIKSKAQVTDFDMIGFSYYPLWHTTVPLEDISTKISGFKSRYNKDVMILETAYPWATGGNDNYGNQFGNQSALAGFPFTEQGQFDFMKKLTQEVKDGGGKGLIYWEPAWITSQMKDLWGTGSSWENCTFFNFAGEKNKGMDFMKVKY
jgi:arabinogalactan endo-1,4-beta-galactosidase